MSFWDQLKRVRNFLTQKNLEQTPITYEPAPEDVQLPRDLALLVIDVQQEFCDPNGKRGNDETREVSQRIKNLVPEFRKAGIPVYVVYFSKEVKRVEDIDFYEFRPEKSDFVIPKSEDSAFDGSSIHKILARHGRKSLLTCGFNLNACIFDTVMDARSKGYDVRLLRDLTGNDNDNDRNSTEVYVQQMRKSGVVITNSSDELRAINTANASAPRQQPQPATASA